MILFTLLVYGYVNYDIVYEAAKMSHNVYYKIGSKSWKNVSLDQVFDVSVSNDTVKSYFFTNAEKNMGVVSFKGTSLYWTGGNNGFCENTNVNMFKLPISFLSRSSNDKYNDNLFFSCCFYKQSNLFEKCNLCNHDEKQECCVNCYKNSLQFKLNYINIIKLVIEKVKTIINFETSKIFFTGHSLGGILASISGSLYNKPTITFQTPGDKHYFNLAGITSSSQTYHFGHNGDPIFIGNCGLSCSLAGYYIDTKCHTGYTCLYDSKKKLGYSESILNHRIDYIIDNVIPEWKTDFPECVKETSCIDCNKWNYTQTQI